MKYCLISEKYFMHSHVEDTFQSYLKLLELNIVKNVTVKKEASIKY